MPNLTDILQLVNYREHGKELKINELLAWTKLLAYRKCFNKPQDEKKDSLQSSRIKDVIVETIPLWHLIGLEECYLTHDNNIISNDEAYKLLEITFPSYEIGYKWLRNITQIHFLRKDFDNEGLTREKEQAGLYPLRMLEEKCINIRELKNSNKNSIDFKLYDIANTLHLLDHASWPEQPVTHVVMLGHVDKYIKECIEYMPDFNGVLYYLNGPRGLFNHEAVLAPLLASWFGMPEKIEIIQQVLNKYKSMRNPHQWTMDLSLLKLEIMKVLGVTAWPKVPHSYYYQDKATFDLSADELKRERLDCLGGPWPVAMDMVDFYIKQKQRENPGKFQGIKLVQVVTKGSDQKLPTMDSIIQTWYDRYGRELLEKNEKPIFLACSLTHRLPYVINTLLNKMCYKDALKIQTFNNRLLHFKEEKSSFVTESIVQVVGPKAKELNMVLALDCLAKAIYSLDKNISTIIQEYELYKVLKQIDVEESQVLFALQMQFYHKNQDHLRLASSTFNLAETFHKKPHLDLIKSSGLLNFAMNVLRFEKAKDYKNLIINLHDCTLINMQHYFIASLSKIQKANSLISMDVLRQIDIQNRMNLSLDRQNIYNQLELLKNEYDSNIFGLYKYCHETRAKFFSKLIQQSFDILSVSPVKFEFIYFGSSSRIQATPFSDLEFMILLEENDPYSLLYFVELSKILLLKILNLGETYLPALNIIIKDKYGKQYPLAFYDKFTPVGFCYDADTDRASMVPLGIKHVNEEKRDRLIGTAEELIKMLAEPKGFRKYVYFQQSLLLSTLVKNEFKSALYENYKEKLKNNKQFDVKSYALWLLQRDLQTFIYDIDAALKMEKISHEKYFYRPISAIIDDLYMLTTPNQNLDSSAKLNIIEKHGIISYQDRTALESILKTVMYLRMQMHYFNKRHEIYVSKENEQLFNTTHFTLAKLNLILKSFDNRWKKYDIDLLKKEYVLSKQHFKEKHYLISNSNIKRINKIMPQLKDVFALIDYTTKEQQISYVKYLAYRNCFSKPTISEDKSPQKARLESALIYWKKTNLKEHYPHHKNNIISDQEAEELLNSEFPTLKDGYEWLLSTTQAYFLRETFDLEGIGSENEKKGVNLARYNPKDELGIDYLEEKVDKKSDHYLLYTYAKHLRLIDEVPIPLDKDIEYFLIHACVEKYAKDRANFMEPVFQKLNKNPSKTIKIYYTTNPRGLFNNEESLAHLLAEQFNMPEKLAVIKEVLKRHYKDDKTWTLNLTALKQEIMQALGVSHWPESLNSFYYNHSEKYDMRAKLEGRESLKDWPGATDMIARHLQKLSLKYPNVKYRLFEVIGHGKNKKIANTGDLTRAWVDDVGDNIIPPEFLVFISDNSCHAIENQRIIAKPIIEKLPGIEFICVGPGAKTFSLATALDMLTKTLYAIHPNIINKIEKLNALDQTASEIKPVAISQPITAQDNLKSPINKQMTKCAVESKPKPINSKDKNPIKLTNKWSFGVGATIAALGMFAAFKIFSNNSSAVNDIPKAKLSNG